MLGSGSSISPVISNMHNTQARSFDGSDQDVNIDGLIAGIADVVKTDETEFSISLWCKLSASIGASVTIFKCRNTGSTNNQIILLYHANENEFRFTPKFGGTAVICSGGTTNADGDSYEGDGIWHHIVGTVSITDDTQELWIDGDKKDTENGVRTLDETINDASLFQHGADGSYFDGDVKDVAIYGRQLTDAEIGVIYNARGASGDKGIDLVGGSHVNPEGLIAHFRFEEKSGTVAINEVGVRTEGAEEVTNGDFANGETDWTFSAQCEVVNNQARILSTDGSFQYISQNNVFDTSKNYKLEFDIISSNGATLGLGGGIPDVQTTTLGRKTIYTSSSVSYLQIKRSSGVTDVVIDNVSVKEYTTTDGTYVNAPAITTNIP